MNPTINDEFREALRLQAEAATAEQQSRLVDAQRLYLAALDYARRVVSLTAGAIPQARILEGQLCASLGSMTFTLGDSGRALEWSLDAVRILQEVRPHSEDLAFALVGAGGALRAASRFDEAIQFFTQAQNLASEASLDPRFAAVCKGNIAQIRTEIGDYEGALALFTAVAETYESLSGPSMELALTLNSVAACLGSMGRIREAAPVFDQALAMIEDTAPRSLAQATILGNFATSSLEIGDVDRSLSLSRDALDIVLDIAPDSLSAADAYNRLGKCWHRLGESERAQRSLEKAISCAHSAAPGSLDESSYLNNLGDILREQGRLKEAIGHFSTALTIAREAAPHSDAVHQVMSNLALAFLDEGLPNEALGILLPTIDATMQSHPISIYAAGMLSNVALAYTLLKDPLRAIPYMERAIEILDEIGPASIEMAIYLANLAHMWRDVGDTPKAIRAAAESIGISETIRVRAGGTDARESVFGGLQDAYQLLTSLLDSRRGPNDLSQSFQVAEKARARSLVELLAQPGVELFSKQRADPLLLEEKELQAKLASAYNRASRHEGDFAQVMAEVERLQELLDRVRARIRQSDPEYASLKYPETVALDDVQSLLDSETLLLEYDMTGPDTFVWAVREDSAEWFRLSTSGDDLHDLIERAVGAYQSGPLAVPGPSEEASRKLSEILLGPIPPEMWSSCKRVLVIPDGPLHYLPLEMLPHSATDEPLMMKYEFTYAPSATTLRLLSERSHKSVGSGGGFVGFGDPVYEGSSGTSGRGVASTRMSRRGLSLDPLLGTAREVNGIADLFGQESTIRLGSQATEYNVKRDVKDKDYVHFATHALLDDHEPLYSGLALSPPAPEELAQDPELDDFFQTYEVFSLDLSAKLVVCSGCQTGLGRIKQGEGLVGMSRAFFFAGASCVVLSLWPVDDESTAAFMIEFYSRLLSGSTIAQALRLARLEISETYPDPYYWAGFVSSGLSWSEFTLADASRGS